MKTKKEWIHELNRLYIKLNGHITPGAFIRCTAEVLSEQEIRYDTNHELLRDFLRAESKDRKEQKILKEAETWICPPLTIK